MQLVLIINRSQPCLIFSLLLVSLILSSVTVGQAQPIVNFTEYTIPTPESGPHDAVSDSKGHIWYTGQYSNKVGVLDPSTAQFQEFIVPTSDSGPHGLTIAPGDIPW
ncbi:MAG TPA: hypothetical protein VJZ03_02860, partial [Candidatus Bathyarchaeia archaeon]|nr:hypothetical protein [Candidatus Bathyarchaeia archaeon]